MFWRRNKFRADSKSCFMLEFNECARRQASELGLGHDQQTTYLQRLLKDNIAQVRT
jgi:hypothetical protein